MDLAASSCYTTNTKRHDYATNRERERERESSNVKTLFYKDCSLGLVKNQSNN